MKCPTKDTRIRLTAEYIDPNSPYHNLKLPAGSLGTVTWANGNSLFDVTFDNGRVINHFSGQFELVEPKKIIHVVGRVRHPETAFAFAGYFHERWARFGKMTTEKLEGEDWLGIHVEFYHEKDAQLWSNDMVEAVRAFQAGRKSMVD
jgi:hypothetical protein